jgi:hypothetical protein
MALVLLLFAAIACVALIKLDPADGTRVIIFEPVLDAGAVEGVIAWQLAACLTIGALLEANVAVRLFALFFLGKVLDEVS